MILYHGTSTKKAKQIMANGFTSDNRKTANWKVKSKNGYVYLSLAYAPFYAQVTTSKAHQKLAAIIKVKVNKPDLFPDDDFVMYAKGKNVYTQHEIDNIDLQGYKYLTDDSLQYLGNACALHDKVKILGMREFDCTRLVQVCDPSITPINYKFKGEYYRQLTEIIYEGKDFLKWAQDYNKKEMELLLGSINSVIDTPKSNKVFNPDFISKVKGENKDV